MAEKDNRHSLTDFPKPSIIHANYDRAGCVNQQTMAVVPT